MKASFDGFFFILAVLALCFLFQGEPDLWDKLHEKAMTWANASQEIK